MRDLIALDDSSKVWIYQASRELTYDEIDVVRENTYKFISSWVSHNQDLMGYGNIFHRRFLAFFVDESRSATASGCSIDKSVNFVKQLQNELKIDFFDRTLFCYMIDEEIKEVKQADLPALKASQGINEETLFFDNLVKNKGDFLKFWIKPLKDSWQHRFA